jgi:hypothetical protein
MNLIAGSIWSGNWEFQLPPQDFGETVYYYIEAYDFHENYIRGPGAGTYDVVFDDPIAPVVSDLQLDIPEPDAYEDVSITIDILENGSGIENVTLYLSIDGGVEWNQILMDTINANTYNATIPGQSGEAAVKYYFLIYDKSGNSIRNPTSGSYTLSFTPIEEPKDLIPIWLFWLIMGIIGGIFVGSLLIYGGKKVVAPPPPPPPPKKQPPEAAIPTTPATPEVVVVPPKEPPPSETPEMRALKQKFDETMKRAESALSKNYLDLAHTNLFQAADIAFEMNNEDVARELLIQAKEIKAKMETPSVPEPPPDIVPSAPEPPVPVKPEFTAPLKPEPPTPAVPEVPTPSIPEPTAPTPPEPIVPPAPKPTEPTFSKWTKPCPHCGKWISRTAESCPYCRNPTNTE